MIMISKITEVTIYESPDGGRTVYSRKSGDASGMRQLHSVSTELETEMARLRQEERWMEIFHAAERSPALQEAIDRVMVIYELGHEGHSRPGWHPV